MTTTLLLAEAELSRQLGDFWDSTTTSAGDASGTFLIDTGLKEQVDEWITPETFDMLTSGDQDEEERKVLSLNKETGTLTFLPHGGDVASGVTYRVHRLFSASEKGRALVYAARHAFPHIFNERRDESKVLGNWLRNSSFEIWTASTVPDYFVKDTTTLAENTTAPYVFHGSSSMKLSTAAGNVYTNNTQVPDFNELAGRSVTLRLMRAWCDTASCLRIAIYDGADYTYSDYHDGDSAVRNLSNPLYVTANIAYEPTEITFIIYHDVAAGTSYVDDLRMTDPVRNKIYIGDLNFAQDRPHQVSREQRRSLSPYSQREPWVAMKGWEVDKDDYLHIPAGISDYRLRIEGIDYLDFILSGASSTDWSATIAIDSPQLDILVAEAAIYLYQQKLFPNYTTGDTDRYEYALRYWFEELRMRQGKFGMIAPATSMHRGNDR